MHQNGRNLALIVGHYKSGSSWLDNVLSGHPSIRGLAETHVFRYTATMSLDTATRNLFTQTAWSEGGWRKLPRHRAARWLGPVRRLWRGVRSAHERPATLLDLSIPDQIAFRRTLLRSGSKEEYCRRFFAFLHDRLKPRGYLVEKTPNNILHVPYIKSVFPEAKLIAIYRDGRDVAVSDRYFRKIRGREYTFADSVLYWRQLMEAQFAYADTYGIFTCSYESLLQDGAGVVQKLMDFMQLSATTADIHKMLHGASFEVMTGGRKPGQEDQNRFYRKGVSGDWKERLSDGEKEQFKELAGDVLIRLGYERDNTW